MERNINVAKILKDKSKGTKLYSTAFGQMTYIGIAYDTNGTEIWLLTENEVDTLYLSDGKYREGGEVTLYPSKEMRDWNKFAWKKGDVLVSNDYSTEVIFDKWYDDTYTNFYGKHYLNSEDKNNIKYNDTFLCTTGRYSLEDKNAAQTYINTIEERLGGKLNRETLEIEKQPEFKDGDIVIYGKSVAICRKIYKHTLSFYVSLNEMFGLLFADEVESSEEYRFATEEEKQQLFDALEKEGKAWDAEKKQIEDSKSKVELKPFGKVLVRDSKSDYWRATLFSHIDKNGCYYCVWASWNYCIPYEGNESLLGTNKNVES